MRLKISYNIIASVINTALPVNNIGETYFDFIEIRSIAVAAKDSRTNTYLFFGIKGKVNGKPASYIVTGKDSDYSMMLFD